MKTEAVSAKAEAGQMVGQTIWHFDPSHRVYEKGGSGPPIYREYWRPMLVFGETSRSWVCGSERHPYKVPKAGPRKGFALSVSEVDEDCWQNAHRYRIIRAVEHCSNQQLRQIAELIGYQAAK